MSCFAEFLTWLTKRPVSTHDYRPRNRPGTAAEIARTAPLHRGAEERKSPKWAAFLDGKPTTTYLGGTAAGAVC